VSFYFFAGLGFDTGLGAGRFAPRDEYVPLACIVRVVPFAIYLYYIT
jgi:hypothetical protein